MPVSRRTVGLLAVPHHVTKTRVACLALAWFTVPLLSRVTLFEIDPTSSDYVRPLEQLGALGLCLPVAVATIGLSDACAWVLHASGRRPSLVRLYWLLIVTATSALFAGLPMSLLPSAVPVAHVWWVWLLLQSLGVLSVVLLDESIGGLTAIGFVVVATIPGVLPWEYNLVYNLDAERAVRSVSLAALVLAGLCYTLFGDSTGRREHPSAT